MTFSAVPTLEIVLQNLTLPGQPAADQSLSTLIENTSVSEWISTGISLLTSELAQRLSSQNQLLAEIAAMVTDALNLLGLSGSIPGFNWQGLVESPSNASTLFVQWLQAIVATPAQLQNWMNVLYCLFQGTAPAADGSDIAVNVTGTGTPDDPFAIQLANVAGVLAVDVTMATSVDSTQICHLYPGVRVSTSPMAPVSSAPALGVVFSGAVEFVDLALPPAGQSGGTEHQPGDHDAGECPIRPGGGGPERLRVFPG